eukprot:gene2286-2459_t
MTSNLFEPFKKIGIVIDKIPPFITSDKIYASVGRSYHCYNLKDLKVIHIGPELPEDITNIVCIDDIVYGSCGQNIYVMKGKEILSILTEHHQDISNLIVIGGLLLSFSENDCIVWNENEKINEWKFNETITCIIHPYTYLDKILIGTEKGDIFLMNIRVGKVIYKFGNFSSSISCMENSNALDIISIGLSNGKILLFHLKKNLILFQFEHLTGPITSLSFRTDKENSLISSNSLGEIAIWDLMERKLLTLIENQHKKITKLYFVFKEPIFFSFGEDNTINQFIMDRVDKPRVLRYLKGPIKPPSYVRFYDPMGNWVLTIDENIRLTSLFSSKTSELSSKKMKLPTITDLDFCYLRQDDWDNLVTCHNDSNVNLWNVKNQVINEKMHLYSKGNTRSVCLSTCGNFVIIGKSNGKLEKWNIQSGLLKGIFEQDESHFGAISGIKIDSGNSIIVSSGWDGNLKFWDFKTLKLISTISSDSPITKMIKSNSSNLIAIITDDFDIKIFDIRTFKLIRKFSQNNKINDITFSNDSKYLISSSMDGSLMVYDLISSHLIDWIIVENPITSLSFHPNGLYLVTTHKNSVGIYLWINKLIFGKMILKNVDSPTKLSFKEWTVSGYQEEQEQEQENEKILNKMDKEIKNRIESNSKDSIKLSGIPKEKLLTLLNLDEIRKESKKDKEMAKIIAPFFLTNENKKEEDHFKSKLFNNNDMIQTSSSKMIEMIKNKKRNDLIEYFKNENIKNIDISLRSLKSNENMLEMKLLLDFFISELKKNQNFDLIQSLVNLFLKIHSELIIANSDDEEIFEKLENLKMILNFDKMDELIHTNTSLIKILSGLPI